MTRRTAGAAAAIFLAVAGTLFIFHAPRLIFSPDEGIMLEAAQRMLRGQKLYVDFFGYMSPGSYWLQELVFRCLGLSLRAARLVVILDFAVECALIFWITARFGHRKAAFGAAALFFLFEASNPTLILPWHWWDSTALSLLAIALGLEGAWTGKRRYWLGAGMLVTLAAFCTPSIAYLAVITGLATLAPSWRRFLPPFVLAAAATAATLVLAMMAGGYLQPLMAQMRWLSKNYTGVNVTPYGAVLGGYAALLEKMAGVALPIRGLLLLSATLAAVLPVVAILGWGTAFLLRKGMARSSAFRLPILYLLACMAGYVASTYPRPDMTHLMRVAPLAYVLVTILICEYLPTAARTATLVLMASCAAMPAIQSAIAIAAETPVATPVGKVRVAPEDRPAVQRLLRLVRPGQTLYVHPYLPLFYFLTQTANPTRFSYLQPGMMTGQNELEVLHDLERSPPEWILYLPLQREDYLRVFPSAKDKPYRFEKIEAWLHANYAELDPPLSVSGYHLLARYDWESYGEPSLGRGHHPRDPVSAGGIDGAR